MADSDSIPCRRRATARASTRAVASSRPRASMPADIIEPMPLDLVSELSSSGSSMTSSGSVAYTLYCSSVTRSNPSSS